MASCCHICIYNADNVGAGNDITGAAAGTKVLTFTAAGITVEAAYDDLETDITNAFGDAFASHVSDVIVVTNKQSFAEAKGTYTIYVNDKGVVTGAWT